MRDLELELRTGGITIKDVVLLKGRTGTYGDPADADDPGVPIKVVKVKFRREVRMEVHVPDKPVKQVKILCPWLLVESTDPTFPGQLWVKLGDPDLDLEGVD